MDILGVDPLLLLAIILGAIGTIGTVLTSVSNVQQIWQRARAKPRGRENEVKELFRLLRPVFLHYEEKTSPSYEWDFLKESQPLWDAVVSLVAVLTKTDSKIEAKLKELFGILSKTNYFVYGFLSSGAPETASNPRVKTLVSELRRDIDKWLSKHS